MTTAGPLMFHELAPYYDAFVEGKDYLAETRRMVTLARRYGRSGGRRWLDVACGTGRHLEHLRSRYSVTGVDVSPEMIRVAHRRLPGVRLHRADMRSFRLDRKFDVVSCVFSAIAHVRSERELRSTFSTFAAHLRPGGVVIIEPWLNPQEFRPGTVFLMANSNPSTSVARLSYTTRRGHRTISNIHYLVGENHRGVRHYSETDLGLMVPRQRLLQLLRNAGFHPRYIAHGIRKGRGVIVAVRSSLGNAS